MITGTINSELEPLLDDIYIEGKDAWLPLRTILDTGFNGSFCLPKQFAGEAGLLSLGEGAVELADGSKVNQEIFLGTILVNNHPYPVELTLTDSDTALMGMAMLLEKEAIFNLKAMTVKVV
ncbi:hypothetical protein MHK_009585 [Candidatus Magnetomorum sp. HK-1]|nr:hypothetical protein MHK_009585 [Candidatus Magnetomorum sp. HK-1]